MASISQIAERVDPFGFVPRQGVTARICALGPFHLRQPEYEAVMEVSGARSALLANLTPDGEVDGGPVWRLPSSYPFERLKSDPAWAGIGQSVIWDPTDAWLVIVSNEGHGIVAGPRRFVDTLTEKLSRRGYDTVEIIDRLIVGRPETAAYDHKVMAMVERLYGAVEAHRIRGQLGRALP